MKKWNSFFQIFFKVAALSFPAKAILLFFQCFLPRNVSKSSFFSGRNKLFLFSQGRVEIFLSRRLEIVVPREGKNPCCLQGLPLLSQGIIFVLRGDESAQRAPKDKNYPEGPQGQGLGTTRILSLPRDDKALPEGWKNSSTLPREDKKKLVSSRKKKILKHFWAENTEKIVIWPWQEKVRLQPWQKKSEK